MYGVLRRGANVTERSRVLARIPRLDVSAAFPRPSIVKVASVDFASAVWRPSPNFDERASGDAGTPHMVIIHTCEGNYASCWGWLVNPASHVSAHYVVNEDGSEISQLVEEPKRAWHIAATYDCTLNANHDCWRNGQQSNHFTIGIEHAGFASQTTWSASPITLRRLVCDITRDRASRAIDCTSWRTAAPAVQPNGPWRTGSGALPSAHRSALCERAGHR